MRHQVTVSNSHFFTAGGLTGLSPLLPEEKSARPGAGAEGRPVVLVSSYEDDTRFLFKTLLEMWGYEAAEAENLEDTLASAESGRPDLILLDSGLPFVENLLFIRRVRENDALGAVPIVVVSGFAQPRFRSLALVIGADDYLVKPVDFDLLASSLDRRIRPLGRQGEII